jgi:uncharacterized membrane protein
VIILYYVIFLHGLGAIAAGFYLLLPFLLNRIDKLPADQRLGYMKGFFSANRIGQYVLIAQFLTGGYLISQKNYAVFWMVLVIALFIFIAALAGMMARPMKRYIQRSGSEGETVRHLGKAKAYSAAISIGFLLLVILMYFPSYR